MFENEPTKNIYLKEIHDFLVEAGWEDCEYGQYLSKDREFKIYVGYDEDNARFIVRSAIFRFFDRWANSGSQEYFGTVDEVIEFLKGKYVASAFEEIISIIEDGIIYNTKEMDDVTYKAVIDMIDTAEDYFGRRN